MENKNIQVSKEELDLLISALTQTIDYWENLGNADESDDFYFADDHKVFNMMNDLRSKLVDYR